MPYFNSEVGIYDLPNDHNIMLKMKKPSRKLTVTPPIIIIRRCQAGLERNSQGLGGSFSASVSILSSTIPEIFT